MKTLLIDYRVSELEVTTLHNLGYNILKCPKNPCIYEAINGHPDILLHPLSKSREIIVHKDIDDNFIKSLQCLNYTVIKTLTSIKSTYPNNIILNALNLENIFLHKLDSTDPHLLKRVGHKTLINVKQGYTKCSTAVISDNAIMTSDTSIWKILSKQNIDVLLLPPKHILLPHLDYGFIGGTCGLLEENLIGFFGNLETYPFKDSIKSFLRNQRIDYISLGAGPLIDRGSILSL
ncbi:MAG: hypothetical protein RSB70_04100 [Clostridium sp.]